MTPTTRFRLGLAVPVFAAPGIPTLRTPSIERISWSIVRDAIVTAERLGLDSAWFSDHLFHGRDGEFFESWTAMSVAAGCTDRIRLVNNHLGTGFRDARIVAKMATTLADVSGGRFDLFLARGYREREYASYGLPFADDTTRTRRLGEAVEVVRALWSAKPTDFDGEFYELHGAMAAPSAQSPPFIWLGGPLDDDTLALVASKADGWNTFPLGTHDYAAAAHAVEAACAAVDRDPATLRRSLETQVLVLDDWMQWQGWLDRWRSMREAFPLGDAVSDIAPATTDLSDEALTATCRESFIIGTREEVRTRIEEYRSLGVTDLICWFMDAPSTHSMSVVASLRNANRP